MDNIEDSQPKKYSDFQRNRQNPFLEQAIEEINKNLVKKYQSSTGTSQKAILQAFNPETGEVLGHTTFIRQIEVDEQEFAKLYLKNFKVFFDLSDKTIRVFGYILNRLVANKDEFTFFVDECQEYTGYKTKATIYAALTELIRAGIVAKGRNECFFFINPMVVFNGNRATFARSYVRIQSLPPKNNESTDNNND